jgi:hypothetical protein
MEINRTALVYGKKYLRMKGILVSVFIFGGIAILLAFASSVLFYVNSDLTNGFGILSTIMSVILSIVAVVYTYISGKETLKIGKETLNTLEEIKSQNKNLVNKINQDLLKTAFDESGIKNIRERRRYRTHK